MTCIFFRRKLVPGRVVLLGHEIDKVDWAEPENEVDEETMATVSNFLFSFCFVPSFPSVFFFVSPFILFALFFVNTLMLSR